MKIKVTAAIKDYEGKDVIEGKIPLSVDLVDSFRKLAIQSNITAMQMVDAMQKEIDKSPLTIRAVINYALNTPAMEGERRESLSATDKAKGYEISRKLWATKEPDFTDDQVKFIKERVEKLWNHPLVVGTINEILSK